MPTKTAWAIKGNYGLYSGSSFSRAQAIADHLADTVLGGWPAFANSGPCGCGLSKEQREAWEKRRRHGDRAIKVRITYG